MLRWRLLLGILLIAALVALCWLDHRATLPGVWLLPLALVATVLATKEVLDLAASAQMRPVGWAAYCGNLLLVSGSWLVMLHPFLWTPWRFVSEFEFLSPGAWAMILLLSLGAALLLLLLGGMWRYRAPGGTLANLGAGTFALIYVGFLLNFAVQLRVFWGIAALASWVIVVKAGDIGAYTVGRLFGRHKMAPLISPGKTLEGAGGALLFSCVAAWATFAWLVPQIAPDWIEPGRTGGWLVFGLLVGLVGMLGDLAESLIKRDVGVKDSSTWLPGFGGVLDILDSLLLSAPVAWFCWASGLVGR
jgi:phosphatidate cytidylyltransferase